LAGTFGRDLRGDERDKRNPNQSPSEPWIGTGTIAVAEINLFLDFPQNLVIERGEEIQPSAASVSLCAQLSP